MGIGKRLFHYGWMFKRAFVLAFLMLCVSIGAELAGPFIAKQMIDVNIVGIEKPWYAAAPDAASVSYNGQGYKREDRFQPGEAKGKEVRVLQVGRQFVFVDGALAFDGKRDWKNGKLTISNKDRSETYEARKLSAGELFAFYKPELPWLYKLAGIYMGLIGVSSLFHYGQRYLFQTSANRVIRKLRYDVYKQIQRLPISYFDNLPAGKVVSRVTNDTEAVKDLFVSVLSNFFSRVWCIFLGFLALCFCSMSGWRCSVR